MVQERNNPNPLERTIENNYLGNLPRYAVKTKGPKVKDALASRAELGQSVQGFYTNNTATVANDLEYKHGAYFGTVRTHEHVHHEFGTGGDAHGEYLTDILTAWQTGHSEFIRGPFYRPPINLN